LLKVLGLRFTILGFEVHDLGFWVLGLLSDPFDLEDEENGGMCMCHGGGEAPTRHIADTISLELIDCFASTDALQICEGQARSVFSPRLWKISSDVCRWLRCKSQR
jgi:hypothetical protein